MPSVKAPDGGSTRETLVPGDVDLPHCFGVGESAGAVAGDGPPVVPAFVLATDGASDDGAMRRVFLTIAYEVPRQHH